MKFTSYDIYQDNNKLDIFRSDQKKAIYNSFWYMEFGKTCAEIKDASQKKIYTITKKFQFWQWRMVYRISRNLEAETFLISQNTRNTIFKMELLSGNYEIKVHYQKKKSIYKNDQKIAEFDESLHHDNSVKLLVLNDEEIRIVFLLYVSLLIGVNDLRQKSALKSQKRLEKNLDPWF